MGVFFNMAFLVEKIVIEGGIVDDENFMKNSKLMEFGNKIPTNTVCIDKKFNTFAQIPINQKMILQSEKPVFGTVRSLFSKQ